MGATISPEQVLLLRALLEQKNKSIKWVLEHPEKLRKPVSDESKADLVHKFSEYNNILGILGGTILPDIGK